MVLQNIMVLQNFTGSLVFLAVLMASQCLKCFCKAVLEFQFQIFKCQKVLSLQKKKACLTILQGLLHKPNDQRKMVDMSRFQRKWTSRQVLIIKYGE